MKGSLTKRYILYFLIHFSFIFCQGVVQNVSFNIIENDDEYEMAIYYTIYPDNYVDHYKIQVLISSDGGRTWFTPNSVQGDIGLQKGSGSRKITWDIFSDVDELEGEIKVKVSANAYIPPSQKLKTIMSGFLSTPSEGGAGYAIAGFNFPKYKSMYLLGLSGAAEVGNGTYSIGFSGAYAQALDSEGIPTNDNGIEIENLHTSSADLYWLLSFKDILLITPSTGFGYELSGLRGTVLNEDVNEGVTKANTSGLFMMFDIKFKDDSGKGWGISFKKSLMLEERNWSQINFYFFESAW